VPCHRTRQTLQMPYPKVQTFWHNLLNCKIWDYDVPENIQNILKTSCYDCHSNNTNYPWYNKIQPVNWWLADHINEGKEELNFDEFNAYSTKKKLHKLDEVIETIKDNEMPLKSYTLIHSNAKLSENDKQEIEAWVKKIKSEIE
jgi:hypothetical protein